MPEAIVVFWPHMMSDILVGTAWSIGLTPYQCQVITSTNPDFLWIEPSTNPDFLWKEPSLPRWQETKLDDIVQTVFQMLCCDWKLVSFIQQLIKKSQYLMS